MRVQRAQQPGDGALVESLGCGDGVGGVPLRDGVGAEHASYLAVQIVGGRLSRGASGQGDQGYKEAEHQSGQIPATSMVTGISSRAHIRGLERPAISGSRLSRFY